MSAIDYTKAYITNNDGKSLATIDESNTFVDLGIFVDSAGNALTKVYGLAFGKDGEIYLTQQAGGNNYRCWLSSRYPNLESKSTCSRRRKLRSPK